MSARNPEESDEEHDSIDDFSSENEDAFSETENTEQRQLEFGILFDIDGVIARGLNPLPQAKEMMRLLCNGTENQLSFPIAFVTNGCARSESKAKLMSSWFDIGITPDQLIHSQSPLSVFTKWHHKHVLFVGQGAVLEIAADLGFTNVCTLDDVVKAYPLLDIVDHSNRAKVAKGYVENLNFPAIECIVTIGEPVKWESYLQVLIDLLVTDGKPTQAPEVYPDTHLPILACNMDLVFMAEACMPRFGHGSFLLCLESLYEKITGKPLVYTHLIGKPSEITYRYAEDTLNKVAKRIPNTTTLKRMYFVGDNPEVDIKGANLYNKYIGRYRKLSGSLSGPITQEDIGRIRRTISVSASRQIPCDAAFDEQHVNSCISILVGTGVYNPDIPNTNEYDHGHRDIEKDPQLTKPNFYFDDCLKAIQFILMKEHVLKNVG